MPFHTEPEHYVRTGLSDLQGAWENLRAAVAEAAPFPAHDKLLFHIDEGMSWESVRDLQRMRKALLLVRNLVAQNEVPSEVAECATMVVDEFQATAEELGKK